MIFMTTLGIALIEQLNPVDDNMVMVTAAPAILDNIQEVVKLTDTEEGAPPVLRLDHCVMMSKGTCALWMNHELLNYIDYTDFGSELLNLNQTSLAILYERLRIDMELL